MLRRLRCASSAESRRSIVLTVEIPPPTIPGLVTDGVIDPDKLGDVLVFFEYTFDYA